MSDSAPRDGSVQGLNLVISLCLTYTICIVCVRLWIRKGAFGFDDVVVCLATIATLGHTAADYVALVDGLGKPWDELSTSDHISSLNAATVAGNILFTIALYLSKLSVLAFLCRITKTVAHVRMYIICSIIIAAIGLASLLTILVDCPVKSGFYWYFSHNQQCSQVLRWKIFTALDVVTEVLLLVLPLHMLWKLQMPLRKKVMVLVAFYLRAPVIALSIGRNVFTIKLGEQTSAPSLTGALVVIWLEVELAYALAANTLSALKAFTENFTTAFGQGFIRGKEDYDMSNASGKSSKRQIRAMSSNTSGMSKQEDPKQAQKEPDLVVRQVSPLPYSRSEQLRLRPEGEGNNTTEVYAGSWRNHNASRCESPTDDMVILKETELSIHHDQAPILKHAV